MSSIVPKTKRVKRPARQKLSDFTSLEQEAIKAAKQQFGSPVAVLGSRVRGDFADDSDIDIGVNGYDYKKHKALKEFMSKTLGIKVDLFKLEHAKTHKSVILL